ncbi:uncharacterized protein NECHADRAFT_84563 [Fusarium vanettenii 77-13-4]|uniref:DUF6546 domain-containing protein n=1 Tax=Fusarium vanettenii (strain ATCC MYA-4622 / CBS 123669 / FGSC 9596 / NRRL 45880 / 77-13-4) TaxID=660122 RepID=C7YTF2_FUSV7|nr:uncharacterized protein NECHADRAFT_84563 [Fusarium vanettenii 77-13-4]EEU44610.1 hypothetical protein NECHADRAFT_84563 [Fusarium vanettenii 77-13-4]
MVGWNDMAYELRLKVYEWVLEDHPHPPGSLTDYSLVSKEWQQFFEKEIYRHITVERRDFRAFYRIIHRQKHLVKYIWLRIELPRYECDVCTHRLLQQASQNDHLELRRSLMGLFTILQDWDEDGASDIKLEISVWSRSDFDHTFREDVYIDSDFNLICELDRPEGPCDETFREMDGENMWRRPYGLGIQPNIDDLPRVRAITGLLVRRQTRCNIGIPTIQQILDGLPKLKEIFYEPRRKYYLDPYINTRLGYADLALLRLPGTLRRVVIFEDFNEAHEKHILNRALWVQSQPRVRSPNSEVGIAMAHLSLSLEKLSVSYITNATQFFNACKSHWVWYNLRELALTTNLMYSMTPETCKLIVRAGQVAMKMPKLHFMELWHGKSKAAAKFVYQS